MLLNSDLSSFAFLDEPPRIHPFKLPQSNEFAAELFVWRLDLIHPVANGTKLFKLLNYLRTFRSSKCTRITSPGGARSNHLTALAFLKNELACEMEFYIRAWRPEENERIRFFRDQGVRLHFVYPHAYKNLRLRPFAASANSGEFFIPEGAGGLHAEEGLKALIRMLPDSFKHVVLSAGSGQTARAWLQFAPADTRLTIIPVVRDAAMIEALKRLAQKRTAEARIIESYAFGGFGKFNASLLQFCRDFYTETAIPVEPVYSGKVCYALLDLMKQGYFKGDDRVLLLHCGGVSDSGILAPMF